MPAAAVMAMASSVNQRIVKQMAETSFSETDAKAWDETRAELERGWIFRDDAPDLGKVLLAKRFGLAQKEKTRVIGWRFEFLGWTQGETGGSIHRCACGSLGFRHRFEK